MKILSFSTLKTAFSAGIVLALLGTTFGCTVTPRHDGQEFITQTVRIRVTASITIMVVIIMAAIKSIMLTAIAKREPKHKNKNGHHKNKR